MGVVSCFRVVFVNCDRVLFVLSPTSHTITYRSELFQCGKLAKKLESKSAKQPLNCQLNDRYLLIRQRLEHRSNDRFYYQEEIFTDFRLYYFLEDISALTDACIYYIYI